MAWLPLPLFALVLVPVAAVAAAGLTASMAAHQLALSGAGAAWLLAWALAVRRAAEGEVSAERGGGARLALLVAGALALRAVVLLGDPGLSDDLHRYAWEGGLVLEGISPFAHAPSDPELARFRALWPRTFAGLNHPEVSAAYPPVTQAACALVVALAGGVESALLPLRLFFTLCDLLVLVPLLRLARPERTEGARDLRAAATIAWGWSPLVALEFAGSGHFDALGVLLLLFALERLRPGAPRGRERAGLACLAGAVLTKLLPLAALPFVVRGPRWRTRMAWVLGLSALGLAPLLLLAGGTSGLARGLGEYGLRWEAGSLVYRHVEPLFDAWGERDEGLLDPRRLGRACVGAAWLAVGAWLWARRAAPLRATGAWIGAFLVLSPTLHPWYVTWVLPFAALAPSARAALPWLALAALAPLLYWPLERWRTEGVWVEPPWLWPAVALPFFALLALRPLPRAARAPS